MSSSLATVGYALANVVTSVALVLLNKKVFAKGFHFPLTLSFFHFCFTVVFYQLLLASAAFTMPQKTISGLEKFKVATAGVASIGFMNISLAHNSVGFYQVTKLTIVPITLVINYFLLGITTTLKIKLALGVLLGGVGVATVSDVSLNPLGMFFGLLAVLSTALFQIWQGSKQREFGYSGAQLQSAVAPWQAAVSLVTALATETWCVNGVARCDSATDFLFTSSKRNKTVHLIFGTCMLALLVNFSSFGLIGNTSPTTFQVVGHAKTCLVLLGGFLLFPITMSTEELYYNIAGVSVAMVGVVLYGHVKMRSGVDDRDCFDQICPGPILRVLAPERSEEEVEGLTSSRV